MPRARYREDSSGAMYAPRPDEASLSLFCPGSRFVASKEKKKYLQKKVLQINKQEGESDCWFIMGFIMNHSYNPFYEPPSDLALAHGKELLIGPEFRET